jgi:hypothetical protein
MRKESDKKDLKENRKERIITESEKHGEGRGKQRRTNYEEKLSKRQQEEAESRRNRGNERQSMKVTKK